MLIDISDFKEHRVNIPWIFALFLNGNIQSGTCCTKYKDNTKADLRGDFDKDLINIIGNLFILV